MANEFRVCDDCDATNLNRPLSAPTEDELLEKVQKKVK